MHTSIQVDIIMMMTVSLQSDFLVEGVVTWAVSLFCLSSFSPEQFCGNESQCWKYEGIHDSLECLLL